MSAAVNEAWPTQRNAEEAKKNLRNWGEGGRGTRQKFGNVSSGEPQKDSGANSEVQRETERSKADEVIMVKRSTLR